MNSNKKHYTLNLLSTYLHILITSVIGFITVPIALDYWGNDLYGIWIIITSMSSYILASGLGLDVATRNLMTKNSHICIKKEIFKKGFVMMIGSMIVFSLLFILLISIIPEWYIILGNMDASLFPVVKKTAELFILITIINAPFSLISCSFASLGKSYINTSLDVFQSIGSLFSLLFVRAIQGNLSTFVILMGATNTSIGLVKSLLLALFFRIETKKESKVFHEITKDNSFDMILKTGVNLSLLGVPILIVPNLSNLIISNFLDIGSVVPYSLSYKLFITGMSIVMAINASATPLLGKEYGCNNWLWLKEKIKKMEHVTIFLGMCFAVGMIFFSKYVIFLWTGDSENYVGDIVTCVLGLWSYFYCLNNVSLTIINACNFTNKIWVVSWIENILFLLISIFLINKLHIISIPLALFLSVSLISVFWYMKTIKSRSMERLNLFDIKVFFGFFIICLLALFHRILYSIQLDMIIELIVAVFLYLSFVVFSFILIIKN